MGESGIGRLLVASLHQAISELLPERLSFYEPWLTTDGLHINRVSLAGVRAALSFLRQEPDAYAPVLTRAGALAADWWWNDVVAPRRVWFKIQPTWFRRRRACRLAKALAEDAWTGTKTRTRWRRGEGQFDIHASVFCDVRHPVANPLCVYYASALSTFLQRLDVDAAVAVDQCRAVGDERCRVMVTKAGAGTASAAVAAVAVAGVLLASSAGAGPAPAGRGEDTQGTVLVVPFENASRDARLSWLGEGAAVLLTDRLREGRVDVFSRDERIRLFERLQVPPLVTLTRASVIRLGQLAGATAVVTGSIRRDGDDIIVSARQIRLEAGVLDAEVTERAAPAGLMGAFDRLGARLGGAAPGVTASGLTLAAFEPYVKGLLAETPVRQTTFLKAALAANPKLDAARLALWQVQTISGDHRAALESVRDVPESSAQSVDARFLQALSLLHLGQPGEASAVLRALHERAPSPVLLNNIGVAVVRDPSLAARIGRATWYFSQARSGDALETDYVFNLGYAYWLEGDPSGAVYWLKEAVRLEPAEPGAHALLAQALHAAGQSAESYRELSLAQRLSSAYEGLELRQGAAAPKGLERLHDVLATGHGRRGVPGLQSGGAEDQEAQAAFHLDRGRQLASRELDVAAEFELTRAVYFSPYNAEAHLLLGQVYLRSGRLREAIGAVKISLWSEESAAAHLVLAEAYLESGDATVARTEAERALALDPNSVHARKLLERLPKQAKSIIGAAHAG